MSSGLNPVYLNYNEFVEQMSNSEINTRLIFMITLVVIAVAIGFLIYYNTNPKD